MGVTCVCQMPVAEGKSVQQTVELLTRKLEVLGAEKQGTFCVDCETYHTAASTLGSQGQTGKLMYVMHNSEYPLSCFALFESGPCLIADTNFDVLMVKLKGFFQSAKASKIETRGTRYQYCDFLVKVGTVTMGPSARGISVEASSFVMHTHPSYSFTPPPAHQRFPCCLFSHKLREKNEEAELCLWPLLR
ncbi:mediator of RNA polymerase II transcription subunit 20 isoform X3 [Saccopteryx leptura]|uniref:mediator of RNA polymerase II transcription subunit 20 isoform X3 n=1 Tax=Saccopteryx leptura TaxID=249018 RepID=UPI00339D1A16